MPEVPKMGRHYRAPWRPNDPREICVHARVDQLRGTFQQRNRDSQALKERYEKAKYLFDMEAAVDIIEECLNGRVLDQIIDWLLIANKPPLIVLPHPEFDSGASPNPRSEAPTNALPFAFAQVLAAELGCEVDEEITEVLRPGRTKLRMFPRFIWQPKFEGRVRLDRALYRRG